MSHYDTTSVYGAAQSSPRTERSKVTSQRKTCRRNE